jgi:type I restriction enzyme S subunit
MIKTYDKYKQSDDIWLGNIPEHWTISSLKHFVEIISGYAFKSEDYSDDEGVPIIRIGDISNSVDVYNAKKAKPKNLDELERFIIKRGDLLLAMTGATIGKNCMYDTEEISYVNQRVGLLRGKGLLTQAFLKYYIDTPLFREFISLTCSGSAQENISASQVGGLQFPLPTLEEQTKIAQYLDTQTATIDQLIQQKEKLIELLKEKRQAVINEAVTKGLNPNEKMKDSGIEWLGEVPLNWNIIKLRYLCEITTGGKDTENREDDGEYPFFVRSQTIERISTFSFDGEAILTAGDGVGVCKVWHYIVGKFDFHQRVYMMYDFKGIKGKYLFYYMKENFINDVLKLSAKSTVDSLRRPMFLDFKVLVPPSIEEQNSIVEYIEKFEKNIVLLIDDEQKAIEKLKEYRQSIISEAVTGKIDVRDWQPNKQQVA